MSNIAIYISLFAFTLACFAICIAQTVKCFGQVAFERERRMHDMLHLNSHDNRLKELEKRAGIDYSRPETNTAALRYAIPSEKEYLMAGDGISTWRGE